MAPLSGRACDTAHADERQGDNRHGCRIECGRTDSELQCFAGKKEPLSSAIGNK
jgi:hypothetical protein